MFAKSLAWNTHVLHNPPGSERSKIIFNRFQLSERSILKDGSINKCSASGYNSSILQIHHVK
jgi:hypothetical protein